MTRLPPVGNGGQLEGIAYPGHGSTVTVSVALCPAPGVTPATDALTTTMAGPGAAAGSATRVSVLCVSPSARDAGTNVPATPRGKPATLSRALPDRRTTVTVTAWLSPGAIARDAADNETLSESDGAVARSHPDSTTRSRLAAIARLAMM
ncbi:MAG TPA: hypothetical protein VFZ56_13700 [Gemmatimonadaceae bacterium]